MSVHAPARRLRDLAVFVRSKNAGPFVLTIDLFFASAQVCEEVLASGVVSPQRIASLYGVGVETVRVIPVMQATAIKISFPRPVVAGDIGDADVAGGQQFLALLDIEVTQGGAAT